MLKILRALCFTAAALLVATTARADVTAFGFTLGATAYSEVQKRGETTGINLYSQGPMLTLRPGEVELDGLQEFTLIFDDQHKLAAMVLTLGKHRFDAVHGHLRGRYAVRESQIPFVGDRYVRYGAPGATIELNAPHLSFEMTLIYQRDDFRKAFRDHQAKQREEKRRREASQF